MEEEFLPKVAWAIKALTKECQARGYDGLAYLLDLAHQEVTDEVDSQRETQTASEMPANLVGIREECSLGSGGKRVPSGFAFSGNA